VEGERRVGDFPTHLPSLVTNSLPGSTFLHFTILQFSFFLSTYKIVGDVSSALPSACSRVLGIVRLLSARSLQLSDNFLLAMEALAEELLDIPDGFNSDDEIEVSDAQPARVYKQVRRCSISPESADSVINRACAPSNRSSRTQ
jgi:hypothetical protein